MEQSLKLTKLISTLLSETRRYGIKEVSMEQYEVVCRRIMKFADTKGVDEYSQGLADEYEAHVTRRCHEKEICTEYLRFNKRVLRLLWMLAETGEIDFKSRHSRKKYDVSESAQGLAADILTHYALEGEARAEMDIVFRHLFFYAECVGSVPESITDELLMDFFTQELPKTNRGSMGRSLRAIKYVSAYLKAYGMEHLTMDFSQLNARNGHVRRIPPYSQEEIRRMLDSIDTDTDEGLRDYAIMLLAFDTGLRGVDIRTLCLSDIDWKAGRILINQSKTSDPLILPLNGQVMNAIADYILQARPGCGCNEIFLNVKGPVRPMDKRHHAFSPLMAKYSLKAGVEQIAMRSFHSLRRSFATELSAAGVPIETISQLLGHKGIDADKPYLSYNREQVSFCSMGFDEIPIKCGIYMDSDQGGDHCDLS